MSRILSAFIFVLILFTLNACWTCNGEVCPGGFNLKIIGSSNSPLPPGEYSFNIGLEERQFEVACIVTSELASSTCDVVATSPEGWYATLTPVQEGSSDATGPDGFQFDAVYNVPGEYPDNSVRGPERVSIDIDFEGNHLATQEYQPAYQRDKDFWGDEQCGYCDLQVSETLMIDTTDFSATGN